MATIPSRSSGHYIQIDDLYVAEGQGQKVNGPIELMMVGKEVFLYDSYNLHL